MALSMIPRSRDESSLDEVKYACMFPVEREIVTRSRSMARVRPLSTSRKSCVQASLI